MSCKYHGPIYNITLGDTNGSVRAVFLSTEIACYLGRPLAPEWWHRTRCATLPIRTRQLVLLMQMDSRSVRLYDPSKPQTSCILEEETAARTSAVRTEQNE